MDHSMMPDVWTSWTTTPVVWTLLALATAAYVLGVLRVRRWPVARSASWVVAIVLLVVALNSGLAVLSDHLFWVHMVVHLLMIMLIPLFLVLAQPIRLAAKALGPRAGHGIEVVMANPVTRFVTAPYVTVPVYTAVIVLTHLTGFQQQMTAHMWVHNAELVLYLVSGYLLLLPLVGDELTGHDYTYPIRFVTLLLTMGADTMVGVVLMMTSYELAPNFSHGRAMWGSHAILNPTWLDDQNAAGAIMWWAGDGLMMCLLVVLAWEWIRAEGLGRGRQTSASGELGRRRPSFLDTARQSALGADSTDVDDDDAALDAYNARLAAMHGIATNANGRRPRANAVSVEENRDDRQGG